MTKSEKEIEILFRINGISTEHLGGYASMQWSKHIIANVVLGIDPRDYSETSRIEDEMTDEENAVINKVINGMVKKEMMTISKSGKAVKLTDKAVEIVKTSDLW